MEVKAGYKYGTLEEARKANREKAYKRYFEHKDEINQRKKELAKEQRRVAAVIMKNPEMYSKFQIFMDMTHNPEQYQQFLNIINKPQVSN
jgi:hypothetical protein